MNSSTELPQADSAPVRSGFLPDRIIHLHPTRLCNLACVHCYSESDPKQRTALDADALIHALALLRREGYALISLSGGEPLVYAPLERIVLQARSLGYRVTMISNGLLVTERMDPVLSRLDGLAVSFDGLEVRHNAMRGRNDAFARACAALERQAALGRPAAAAISLTRDAIPELPDLADHLIGLGARALQIRPVARAGRARSLPADTFYSATDYARLYLVALALQRELPDIHVHCDLAPAQGLWQERDAYSGLLGSCELLGYEDRPLADLVNPLVITETGSVKPIAYDFGPRFEIGSVGALSSEQLRDYKQRRLSDLQSLIGSALASLQPRQDLVDWFDYCTRLSEA